MSPLKKQNSFEEKLKEQLGGMELKPSDSLWSRIEQNIDADSFEPSLQKKLEDFRVEPSQEVWEQVESQLPESKRRSRIFWFSSLALLLLATFGAGYWFNTIALKNNKVLASATEHKNLGNPTISEGIKPQQKFTQPSSKESSSHISTTENSGKDLLIEEIEETIPAEPSSKLQPVLVQTETRLKKNLPAIGSKKNAQITQGVSASKPTLFLKEEENANSGTQLLGTPPALPIPSQADQANSSKENSNLTPINSSKPTSLEGTQLSESQKDKVPSEIPSASGKNSEPKIILESATINPAPKDSFAEEKLFRGTSYMSPEETFTHFSLSAFAGTHISYMKLEMPTSNAYTNLDKSYDLRKKMESPSLDFAGGLMLNYHIGKGWIFATGIGITAFKQNVQFSVLPAIQSAPSLVQDKNLYVNLNDSIISGNTNSYENRYSFTEIPVWIGYQFPSEGNFHFELMAGASFGKLSLVNAYMTDPGCIGILVANDQESFPKFKNVFFASLAPAASYKVNSSVEVGASVNGKMALNSMVENKQWIQQKPALIGLSLFLRKRF